MLFDFQITPQRYNLDSYIQNKITPMSDPL